MSLRCFCGQKKKSFLNLNLRAVILSVVAGSGPVLLILILIREYLKVFAQPLAQLASSMN